MIDDISQIRTRHLATSGIWFDRPFATGVETFDFDPVKFPDAPTMLAALHDAGLRYGVWHTPYTAPREQRRGSGAGRSTTTRSRTASSRRPPACSSTSGASRSTSRTPTRTRGGSRTSTRTRCRSAAAGSASRASSSTTARTSSSASTASARRGCSPTAATSARCTAATRCSITRSIATQLAHDGAFLLTRTGRWGDQTKGMIIWPGDLDATFDHAGDMVGGTKAVGGLPAALIKGMSLAASGFPFYASDTAGYRHSPATNECWLRWVEANAIASAMEVGDASSAAAVGIHRRATAARSTRSIPTRSTRRCTCGCSRTRGRSRKQIATTGRPIVRPLGLARPELGAHPDDEFMFGDNLLVAPIVAPARPRATSCFPRGRLDRLVDRRADHRPGDEDRDRRSRHAAAVRRAGALVPMLRDTVDTLSPVDRRRRIDSFATDPGVLWVRDRRRRARRRSTTARAITTDAGFQVTRRLACSRRARCSR